MRGGPVGRVNPAAAAAAAAAASSGRRSPSTASRRTSSLVMESSVLSRAASASRSPSSGLPRSITPSSSNSPPKLAVSVAYRLSPRRRGSIDDDGKTKPSDAAPILPFCTPTPGASTTVTDSSVAAVTPPTGGAQPPQPGGMEEDRFYLGTLVLHQSSACVTPSGVVAPPPCHRPKPARSATKKKVATDATSGVSTVSASSSLPPRGNAQTTANTIGSPTTAKPSSSIVPPSAEASPTSPVPPIRIPCDRIVRIRVVSGTQHYPHQCILRFSEPPSLPPALQPLSTQIQIQNTHHTSLQTHHHHEQQRSLPLPRAAQNAELAAAMPVDVPSVLSEADGADDFSNAGADAGDSTRCSPTLQSSPPPPQTAAVPLHELSLAFESHGELLEAALLFQDMALAAMSAADLRGQTIFEFANVPSSNQHR